MELKEYLTKVWGSEEVAEAYMTTVAENMATIKAAGIKSKSAEDEVVEPVSEKPEESKPDSEAKLDEGVIKAIAKEVGNEFKFDDLSAYLAKMQLSQDKLAEEVGRLRKTRDEELVEELTPPLSRYAWANENRPSESNQTELKKESEEDEELKKANPHGIDPDTEWLSAVTKTAPIKEAANV